MLRELSDGCGKNEEREKGGDIKVHISVDANDGYVLAVPPMSRERTSRSTRASTYNLPTMSYTPLPLPPPHQRGSVLWYQTPGSAS